MDKVTQADREAAWPLRSGCYKADDHQSWMAGIYDNSNSIQAFARHRLSALSDDKVTDEVVEAAARVVAAKLGLDWDGKAKGVAFANHGVCLDIAKAAILAALAVMRGEG